MSKVVIAYLSNLVLWPLSPFYGAPSGAVWGRRRAVAALEGVCLPFVLSEDAGSVFRSTFSLIFIEWKFVPN